VAVLAALLGAAVGGYASFRANEALELRRRRARSQVRRKAKIYTPIRQELINLRDDCEGGRHLGYWRIVRENPPPVLRRPASLHLWKDLVEDGRAMTAASNEVRRLLDQVDVCVDNLNSEVLASRDLFLARGRDIATRLGYPPTIVNWVETDTGPLLQGQFDDLNILRTGAGEPTPELRDRFIELWNADEDIAERTASAKRVDDALRNAIDAAVGELDRSMQRIAGRYEHEAERD
jgi:hypothetical protein